MQEVWAERADAAEGAIVSRHLRRLWGMPRTALGVVAWPAVRRERMFKPWHYWWQAHLLDTAIDALERDPTPKRRRRVAKVARSVRVRNVSAWTNNYYDDMAWLGLSLERAQRMFSVDHRTAVQALESQLFDSWSRPTAAVFRGAKAPISTTHRQTDPPESCWRAPENSGVRRQRPTGSTRRCGIRTPD